MNKLIKISLCALVLAAGAQVYAAKITITNNTNSAIGVALEMKGLTTVMKTGGVVAAKASYDYDAGIGGFQKITWNACGKVYEANIDIAGVSAVDNKFSINDNGLMYKDYIDVFRPGEQIQGTVTSDTPCPCVIPVR